MRLAVRVTLAAVSAALVIGLSLIAYVAWSIYQASRPLDMTAVSQLAPVRSAGRAVAKYIDADAAALARGASWLAIEGSVVTDSCAVTYVGDSFSLARNDVPWQCSRQVLEVFGVTGTFPARRTALAADLTGAGYATGSLLLVQRGLYEERVGEGTGQADRGNRGLGDVPGGGFDLTVFWARRPAVPGFLLSGRVVTPAAFLNPAIRHAYARYPEVVIFFYTDTYANGTGMSVSSAATPPPTLPVPCPGTPTGTGC